MPGASKAVVAAVSGAALFCGAVNQAFSFAAAPRADVGQALDQQPELRFLSREGLSTAPRSQGQSSGCTAAAGVLLAGAAAATLATRRQQRSSSFTSARKSAVACRATGDDDDDSSKKALSEFEQGQEVSGTVKGVFDFGTFIDIGAKRDALLGDQDAPKYNKGDKVEGLRVKYIQESPPRIAVTLKEVSGNESGEERRRGPGGRQGQGRKMGRKDDGPQMTLPFNNYFPKDDEKRPELDGVYVPEDGDLHVSYLAEKYPNNFSVADITLPGKATRTMAGCINTDSELQFQVPAHLWKEGSQPELPAQRYTDEIIEFELEEGGKRRIVRTVDNTLEDQKLSYEFGIKPEIHVKYRPYPFNNPNHVEKPLGQS